MDQSHALYTKIKCIPNLKIPHVFDLYSISIVMENNEVHMYSEYHQHLVYFPTVKNVYFMLFSDMKLKVIKNFFICGRTGR
jgi:hypothetical protein